MKDDTIRRAICDSLGLRIYTVTSTDAVREITRIHGTTPNATVALGRTVTGTALLAATLKPGSLQSMAVRFSGNGPLREIYVQADANGSVRGYTSDPGVDDEGGLDSLNFSRAIGAGFLTVIRDLGMGEPYRTVTPLLYGDVAADLAYYLASSEQIPSALILALELDADGGIDTAGGILVQTFPDTKHDVIEKLDDRIRNMEKPLGRQLREGVDIMDVVSSLTGNERISVLSETPLRAACRCDHDMIRLLLKTISVDELSAMRHEDGKAEVTCTFCRKVYTFDADELDRILAERGN